MPTSSSRTFARRIFTGALALSVIVVTLAVLLGLFKFPDRSSPAHYFGEGKFPTVVSMVLLLATSIFLLLAYLRRRRAGAKFGTGAAIWLAGAAAFTFFALDEWLQIHENLDHWIHEVILQRSETALTDRIDDVIVLAYGVIGAVVLAFCTREVLRYKEAWRYPAFAGAAAAGSIVLDIITNRVDTDKGSEQEWASVAEDSLKLFAESGFLASAAFIFAAAAVTASAVRSRSEGNTPVSSDS